MIGDAIREITPHWLRGLVPQVVKDRILGTTRIDRTALTSYGDLKDLMRKYRTESLVNVDSQTLKKRIDEFLNLEDYRMEGFRDPKKQRDLSIKFHWGHDHDFGDFFVKGKLAERHIILTAALIDWFKVLPARLDGLKVLDIGCWTGGTSLLLSAMGAYVVAVEEVRKYIDCLNYLKFAFGLKNLEPRNLSLYECTADDMQDSFDIILFAGVLYHVTDPILALRIPYNCLKDGGKCIIETAVLHEEKAILLYEGPGVFGDGCEANLSRSGWNWFSPSRVTLRQMMRDVGYTNIRLSPVIDSSAGRRIMAVGERDTHRDIMRGGLSVRTIR